MSTPAIADDSAMLRQHFEQWVGTCAENGYCTATNFVGQHTGDNAAAGDVLSIGRPAQQTYWEISFTPLAIEPDAMRDFSARIDDETLTFSGRDEIGAYGAPNAFYFLGHGAQLLLDKLVPGSSLTVDFVDVAGTPQRATFPLAGLSAALIWIDRQQHRIGSERVAETPPYGLVRADLPGGMWMAPAIAALQ